MKPNHRLIALAILSAGVFASLASVAMGLGEGFAGAGISTALPAYVRMQGGTSTTLAAVDTTSLAIRATLYGANSTTAPAVAVVTTDQQPTVAALAVRNQALLAGDPTGNGGSGEWSRWSEARSVANGNTTVATNRGLGAVVGYLEYLATPPTLSTGQWVRPQSDAAGNLKVTFSAASVTANQGTANTAANRWPMYITDGTNSGPTMDAAARAGFFKLTNGTNTATVDGSGFLTANINGTVTSNATLQAGSALVGKVGIDQTTPGTTNGVQITGNSVSAPVQVSESYDSSASKSTNTATSTSATAVPATALAARRLVRLYNDDAAINMYVCLNNASCSNSAGANKGILLPPGGQRDYPVGPTNILYVVAASGTPNIISEELK